MVSKLSPDDLLKNFRSLECAGCHQHFGYQSRTKKELVFCAASCMDEHAGCLPTIQEKEDIKPQLSASLLPTPPLLSGMPNSSQQLTGISPAQYGGFGVPPMQQDALRGSFSSSMSLANDYQNGPRNFQSRDREQGQSRGGSGDSRSMGRANGISNNRSEMDRRPGNYNNGSNNTGYGNRDRNSGSRGGSGPGSSIGGGSDRDRRGGSSYGKKDKNPFAVGDDDAEWENVDIVDKGKDKDTNLPIVSTTPANAVKQQPTKAKEPVPTATAAVLEAARDSLAELAVKEKAPKVQEAPVPKLDPVVPATKIEPVLTAPAEKKVIQVKPDTLLAGLTTALQWTPLEIGVPSVVVRTFANGPGDFFVQGHHIHKAANLMAEQIAAFVADGTVVKLRKFDTHTLCLGPFCGDFYRGEILGRTVGQTNQVDIFFSDFGNIEPVGMELLFELPSVLAPVPRLISHCRWDAVLSKLFSEAKLKELFEDERLPVTPICEVAAGQYVVQLGNYVGNGTFQVVHEPVKTVVEKVQPVAVPVVPTPPPTVVQAPEPSPPAAPVAASPVVVPVVTVSAEPPSPAPAPPTPIEAQAAELTMPKSPATPAPVTKSGVTSTTATPTSARFTGSRPAVTRAKTPVPSEAAAPLPRVKYMLKDLSYSENINQNLELFIAFTWNTTRYLLVGADHEEQGPILQALIAGQYQTCDKLKPSEVPIVGEVLLGPYDGEYYRGVVRSVNIAEKTALLEFIDFGDKAEHKFENLYIPNASIIAVPVLGLNVKVPKLQPVEGMEVTGDVSEYINEPMQLEFLDPTERVEEDLEVVLWIKNDLTFNAVVHKDT